MTHPETQSLLMPSLQVAITGHGITHKSLPCPDELSDTAAFCEHFNVALVKAANTMVVTSRKVHLAVQAVCVVFGTMGMPVYVDSAVLEQEEMAMGGGNRTSKLFLNPRELRKLPGVEPVKTLALVKEEPQP